MKNGQVQRQAAAPGVGEGERSLGTRLGTSEDRLDVRHVRVGDRLDQAVAPQSPRHQHLERRGPLEVRREYSEQPSERGHHEHEAEELVDPPGGELGLAEVRDPEEVHRRREVPGQPIAEDQVPRGAATRCRSRRFGEQDEGAEGDPDQEEQPQCEPAGKNETALAQELVGHDERQRHRDDRAQPERPPDREAEQGHRQRPVRRERGTAAERGARGGPGARSCDPRVMFDQHPRHDFAFCVATRPLKTTRSRP